MVRTGARTIIAVVGMFLLGTPCFAQASGSVQSGAIPPAVNSPLEIELSTDQQFSISSHILLFPADPENKQDAEKSGFLQNNQLVQIDSAVPMPSSSPLLQSAVNITNQAGEHVAIGTKIGENTILTHNHQKSSLDIYLAIDPSGGIFPWIGAKSDTVGKSVVVNGQKSGRQTRLVTFSQRLSGVSASLASQKTIRALQLGDQVEIVYWNDQKGQFATGNFTISDIANINNGTVSVSDQQGIFNPGDSGGGVFFNGELIGNMWSIVGGGHIALIPVKVNIGSRARTIVEPAIAHAD